MKRGYGAIGSASDSRSGGWEFDSLWPHSFLLKILLLFFLSYYYNSTPFNTFCFGPFKFSDYTADFSADYSLDDFGFVFYGY